MILTNCAACAAPLAHNAPRCVRCHTRYCNATCQHDHWREGDVATAQGETVEVTLDPIAINGAGVAIPDVLATNGVVHVIDAVLIPPADEDRRL